MKIILETQTCPKGVKWYCINHTQDGGSGIVSCYNWFRTEQSASEYFKTINKPGVRVIFKG